MSDLDQRLQALASQLDAALGTVRDEAGLEALRVSYLGRSGEVTTIRRSIGELPPPERPGAGKIINEAVRRWRRG